MGSAARRLAQLNRRTFQAENREGDWEPFLRKTLAEDFMLRRSKATRPDENADDVIAAIRDDQSQRVLLDDTVRVIEGDTVGVVASVVEILDAPAPDARFFQNVKVFERRERRAWRLVYWQVSGRPAPRFEASDLLWLDNLDLEERRDWDLAYLVVGDEGPLESGVTVLGHAAGANRDTGWTQEPLSVDCGEASDRTDDAEAIARYDGWIYLVGSHYGSKRGPLQVKRQWIARIAENAVGVAIATHAPDVAVDVMLDKFRLHRAVNDAVRDCGWELIRRDQRITAAFIDAAREEGKDWADRLHDDDWPLNIEAAAFRANGNLLIGLRFPVCAEGSPLAVELEGVTQSFEGNTDPAVAAVWQLDGPGSPEEPVGFRAMVADGADGFDAILGSLDAEGKDSLVIECHPEGAKAHSRHWRFALPDNHDGGLVTARPGKQFDVQGIEGLAHAPGGQFASVIDDPRRIAIQFFAD